MATSFNSVTLVGNITADLELKNTASGIPVCSFSLAVNRKYAKAEQGQQTADFINITAFRHNAEFLARYIKKGNTILVHGQIQTRNYTNKDGQKVYITEIVADEIVALSKNNGASNGAGSNNGYPSVSFGAPSSPNFEELGEDTSLPFD